MAFFTPIARSVGDVITDLKSSWRFRVYLFLWLPLFVVAMIAIVNLGVRNQASLAAPDWRTKWVNEDSGIQFPDVSIALPISTTGALFPKNTYSCIQRGIPAVSGTCPGVPTKITGDPVCVTFKTSAFYASAAYEGQNHITCNFAISAAAGVNTDMNITVPQGFIWQANPPTYVQANQQAEVDFYRERFQTIDGRTADEWFTNVVYQSSNFFAPPLFNATVILRIPVRAQIQNNQYISFDNWMLIASWGGALFFMWFLHGFFFGIAKLWLPNDSKLVASTEPASTYEQIK